jgi:hypothetical protein
MRMLLAALAAALVAPAAASAQIRPGAPIESGGALCTMAWILDGRPWTGQAGGVFGMTAAHCVPGEGAPVVLRGGDRIGVVAFRGDPDAPGRDFAFFRIDPEDVPAVDPRMAGHPAWPTGLPRAPVPGDTVWFSGHGTGFDGTPETRESRFGFLNLLLDDEHQVTGPITPGDSGGPVADETDGGTALGIVTDLTAGFDSRAQAVVTAGERGVNLRFALADAASRGFHVQLRTASGAPAMEEDR